MFRSSYLLGAHELKGLVRPLPINITNEDQSYPLIIRAAQQKGWHCERVENSLKPGFPDLLALRGSRYWLIEVKRLHKKQLVSLEKDLTWQFGQLAYMYNALEHNRNYLLAVVKAKQILYLKGTTNAEIVDFPDFA